MAKVTIYTTMLCPYCSMAKRLLDKRGATYDEIDVSLSRAKRAEMRAKAGGKNSVPQIWIGDVHVGGCDELHELDFDGKLEPMLQG